jgi:hypothetical protein
MGEERVKGYNKRPPCPVKISKNLFIKNKIVYPLDIFFLKTSFPS